jgi:hypothetical protein
MNYVIDRGVEVSAADLTANPWNINEMTSRQNDAVGESIQEFGQVVDLVVRPHPEMVGKYQVIDGEHRLGHSNENVFVTVIHDIPDAQAKKLSVILNETKGKANKVLLTQLLAGIEHEIGATAAMSGLPYSDAEFAELVKMAEVDWDNFSTAGVDTLDALPATEVAGAKSVANEAKANESESVSGGGSSVTSEGDDATAVKHSDPVQSLIEQAIEIISQEVAPALPPSVEEALKIVLDYYIASHQA